MSPSLTFNLASFKYSDRDAIINLSDLHLCGDNFSNYIKTWSSRLVMHPFRACENGIQYISFFINVKKTVSCIEDANVFGQNC